ncbi:hypothetical protein RKD18_007548 [Streptomyces phaeoluteigriseus]
MDRFEEELTRMMRDSRQDTPYEEGHQSRLRAGIRARRRSRTAWLATGSVLTLTGAAGIALMVLPGAFSQGGPAAPQPRPVISAESVSTPSIPRSASAPTGMLMPHRTSSPEPVPMPTRTSASEPVPMPTRTSATRETPWPSPGGPKSDGGN